jgi:lactose/L-arabinose transport system permease protein
MKKQINVYMPLMYGFLIIVSIFSAFPFLWRISASTNKSVDIIKGRVLFGTYFFENLKIFLPP